MANILTNIYFWMGLAFLFLLLFIFMFIILFILSKKTHAIVEIKAWLKGMPIAIFFQDDRYAAWKPVKPEAGVITDKEYGAFLINQKATYIDKTTKNVLLPFDAQFAAGLNVKAAKLVDDLKNITKDQKEFKLIRQYIYKDMIDENQSIQAVKTTVDFSALKGMMTALIPHNINAKIEKVIASRLKSYGNVHVPQIILMFVAMLGAILMGYLIIKLTTGT